MTDFEIFESIQGADPLERFWTYFDIDDCVVSAQAVAQWPIGAIDALLELKFLVPTAPAVQIACPDCPDHHLETVEVSDGPRGTRRYRIPCPQNMFVDVSAADLQQWQLDMDLFARRLKELLNIDGRISHPVPRRLWRIGTTDWKGAPREVYLARGISWPDAQAFLIDRVPWHAQPIVFVGFSGPPPSQQFPDMPPVIRLPTVLSARNGQLSLDRLMLAMWVTSLEDAALLERRLTKEHLHREVHQAVEKISAGGMTEDLVRMCHNQGMSLRETAEELKKRNIEISPSSIGRLKKIMRLEPKGSSKSILSNRSSQPRNSRGKPINDAEPVED